VAVAVIQLVFLAIPVLGFGLSIVRLGKFLLRKARRWAQGSATKNAAMAAALAAAVTVLALAWWPDQRFAPYRPGENGTLTQSVQDLRYAGQGTPLLRSPAEAKTPLPAVPPGSSGIDAEATTDSASDRGAFPGTDGPPTDPPPATTPGSDSPTVDAPSTTSAPRGHDENGETDTSSRPTTTTSPSVTSSSPG
jgi:hypothetical protein